MAENLSPTQRACLEAAAKAPLRRARNGWANSGWKGYPTNTVEALERRGLLKIDPLAACAGEARITQAGRKLLAEISHG